MSKTLTKRIDVTKPFIPPIEDYQNSVSQILESGWLTNQGVFLKELETKLASFLAVNNVHFVTNGTLALQLALNSLNINDGEVITTPFSFVATVSSILWQRCKPVFVDINPDTLSIDANYIEDKITSKTKAIMPVHVFGYACDIDAIQKIADKYNLKVIYDAAHAFGAKYKNKALVSFGDISICSFHATKLFHTIEGGACIVRDNNVSKKLELIKKFGIENENINCLGINAKQTELNAAMGLCILPYVEGIIEKRKYLSNVYDEYLSKFVQRPILKREQAYNYAYYPIILKNELMTENVIKHLNSKNIYPRRYFYPSLNTLSFIENRQYCPISEDISSRIICLPLYSDLKPDDVVRISHLVKEVIECPL